MLGKVRLELLPEGALLSFKKGDQLLLLLSWESHDSEHGKIMSRVSMVSAGHLHCPSQAHLFELMENQTVPAPELFFSEIDQSCSRTQNP